MNPQQNKHKKHPKGITIYCNPVFKETIQKAARRKVTLFIRNLKFTSDFSSRNMQNIILSNIVKMLKK